MHFSNFRFLLQTEPFKDTENTFNELFTSKDYTILHTSIIATQDLLFDLNHTVFLDIVLIELLTNLCVKPVHLPTKTSVYVHFTD